MTTDIATQPEQDESGMDRLVRTNEDIAANQSRSRRHSARVRRMRLLLPVIALIVVAVVMAVAGHEAPLAPVPREQVMPKSISRNELQNPKFQSEDSSNRPYTITAEKATQNTSDMDNIMLDKPVADMSLEKEGWVAIKAANGTYNQATGNLNLDGKVEAHHDSGYELETEKMHIDVKSKKLVSTTPVTGHGPSADITASGLEADDVEKKVTFTGPAKLILRPNETPNTTSPASTR